MRKWVTDFRPNAGVNSVPLDYAISSNFFGDGAMKCQSVIQHKNAHFIDGIVPLAKWMFPLAERSLHLGEKQDVAYFEPFYLKEFVAIKSKNLL